nr:hypothetical protein [uncultured Sphingosinicella sp.]
MQEGSERREGEENTGGMNDTRPQQGGEGGTTRFGMEDGDNTDVAATGGPTSDEEAPARHRQELPEHQ